MLPSIVDNHSAEIFQRFAESPGSVLAESDTKSVEMPRA